MWWFALHKGKSPAFALSTELAGSLLWSAVLISYGLRASYWPLSTPEEFLLLTLSFAALIHLLAELTIQNKGTGWMAPIIFALLALWGKESLVAAPPPPPPAFNSVWFQLHTFTASIAYGAFLVAGATSLAAILEPGQEPQELAGEMAVGYIALTLSMLTGALWGLFTWGSFWGWGLKEIWTLTLWLMATLYFHIRALPRWKGRMSWIVITLIMGVMLFSLMGTGWLARRLTLETLYIF